eukprot:scaffold264981_cov34-Tisochrysis_lutea.AAC.4
MEFPDLIQNFNYPIPGGEVGQNAALAVGAARDGVAPKPAPATLDCRQAVMFVVTPGGVQWCSTRPVVVLCVLSRHCRTIHTMTLDPGGKVASVPLPMHTVRR